MSKPITLFAACALALFSAAPVMAQALSPSQADSLLDEETKRQHERRTQAYERLKGRLDKSIDASAEARNLAVGSTLQMLTPMTDVKVQQLQQQRQMQLPR